MEYNCVLFKLDNGKACACLIMNGEWDFDNIIEFNEDKWPDIACYPFEFVFSYFDKENNTLTTGPRKTTVTKNTFLTLVNRGVLRDCITNDFKMVR